MPGPGHQSETAALSADYTALVGLSQSTSGRVRPRIFSILDFISNPVASKTGKLLGKYTGYQVE